jgi:hypothetical protein
LLPILEPYINKTKNVKILKRENTKKIKKNWKKIICVCVCLCVCVCVCVREREREREKYARMPSKLSKTDWGRLNVQDWKIW